MKYIPLILGALGVIAYLLYQAILSALQPLFAALSSYAH